MKAPHPASPARGFARQRGALETLAEAGYERLKQASDPIAGHTRVVVAAIRSGSEVVSLSADPVRPEPPSPRTGGPAFEIPEFLGCRQALASQVLVSTRIHSGLKSYKDEAKRRSLSARVNRAVSGLLPV